MLPQQVQEASDSELAKLVKDNQSNEAISEIINRHTGIYLSVVNSFKIPSLQKSELLDSKNTNIYKYTLKFDDTKNCKLSSYLYQSTYFDCLKILDRTAKTEEIDENQFSESFQFNDDESVKNISLQIARNVGGRDFEKIIEARHFGDSIGKLSWHLIPAKIGKSHEWARNIYNTYIEKYKVEIKNKFNYIKF
jgi:hypothetical protein